MTGDTVSLFVNPMAGRGRTGRRLQAIKQHFVAGGVPIRVIESRSAGDLEKAIMEHASGDTDRVIVAGGDGSIHEAVNGIMRAGANPSLGIIPTGTGNDFAKSCGVPLDWEHATQLLIERITAGAPARTIDIGRMNDRYFANGAGIGFDAKVTRIAGSIQWPIGSLVYLLAILRCWYDGITTPDLVVQNGDETWRGPVTLVSVCNGPWAGGMFHIAPMANNADGMLDLLLAMPVSRTRIFSLLPKLIQGRHLNEPEVVHQVVRQMTVTAAAPVESHLDGEVQPLQTRFEFEVLPDALKLL
jgi:diacylglycerol kinase (ATP)